MKVVVNFVWVNRQMIIYWVRESFEEVFKRKVEDMEMEIVYDVVYNIVKFEEYEVDGKKVKVVVYRKGVMRVFFVGYLDVLRVYRDVGQLVLILGLMGIVSYVFVGVEGLMREIFGSFCYGVGRFLSRKVVIRQYCGDRFRNEFFQRGIYVRVVFFCVVVEEVLGVYKSVDNVVQVVYEVGIVNFVVRMRLMGVVKG